MKRQNPLQKAYRRIETEVGDIISRQAAIDALNEYFARIGKLKRRGLNKGEKAISLDTVGAIKTLPPAEPKRETATVSVGKSKGGVTMWYECAVCGEPVDQGDTFCSGCGRRLIHE